MVYPVNFEIKVDGCFQTIHTGLIFATSVSECMDKAQEILENLPQYKQHNVHIFIEA